METVQPTTRLMPDHRGSAVARVLAFLGGVLILVVSAPFSLGASLLAPIAMPIASGIWRRRGRRLSVMGHWLAAACGAVVVFVLLAGTLTSFLPKGSWSQITQAADSAQKASPKPPLPAWIERLSPGISARQAAAPPPSERVQIITMAFGGAILLFFFAGLYGSVAWGGGMLIGYGVNGRWPGAGDGELGTGHHPASPVPSLPSPH